MPHDTSPQSAPVSVQDYPRLPVVEAAPERVRVVFNDVEIASSQRSLRVLQRGFPPVYYLPPDDVRLEYLSRTEHHSTCELKGQADYWTVQVGERVAKNAAWSYPAAPPERTPPGFFAFYAHLFDLCSLDGVPVRPPPYAWMGGWVGAAVVGPFLTAADLCGARFAQLNRSPAIPSLPSPGSRRRGRAGGPRRSGPR